MATRRGTQRAAIALVFGFAAAAGVSRTHAAAPELPTRIVSLNLCSDQLLLALAPRSRIAAVSRLATDPTLSAAADAARGVPQVRGEAEEVIALEPDLVVTVDHASTIATDLLRRLGKRVLVLPLATNFDDIRRSVRVFADALGETPRGEALIGDFDARLAAAGKGSGGNTSALVYDVGGLTAGLGTLVGAAIAAAGLVDRAAAIGLGPGGRLPLESLVAAPPDLIVLAAPPSRYRTVVADNLRHPALRRVMEERPVIELPMPLWLCGTPHIAEAVERLAAARRAIMGSRTRLGGASR